MKICDIVQSYSPRSGGVKFYLTAKMRCLAKRDNVQHFAVVPSHRTAYRREYDSTVYEVRSPHLPFSLDYRLLIGKERILAIIGAERPDVIEVDGAYLSAWIGLAAGAQFGIRNVVRIPLGVETDIFYPRESLTSILDRFDLPPETVLLFYAGRLAEMKHIDSLLAMMARLSEDHPDYHLIIAGDGERRDAVSAAANASPHITWLPYIKERDELARFYSAADLFVHAGAMETFGLVSVEAQACGTRVLGVSGGDWKRLWKVKSL